MRPESQTKAPSSYCTRPEGGGGGHKPCFCSDYLHWDLRLSTLRYFVPNGDRILESVVSTGAEGRVGCGVIGVFNLRGRASAILSFLCLGSETLRYCRVCARRSGGIYLKTCTLQVLSSLFNFVLNIGNSAPRRVRSNQFCAQVHRNDQVKKIL